MAWDECVELQCSAKELWVGRVLGTLSALSRFELGIFDGTRAVGAAVIAPDHDVHVGPCMSVLAQYVMPEYRNKFISLRLMRACLALTNKSAFNVLAYTHRLGPWKYSTTYRKVK